MLERTYSETRPQKEAKKEAATEKVQAATIDVRMNYGTEN